MIQDVEESSERCEGMMIQEVHKYLASKHTWRCEDREFTCSMNLKFFCGQQKKKNSS